MDKVVISNLHEHAITNLKEMASVGTLISNKSGPMQNNLFSTYED